MQQTRIILAGAVAICVSAVVLGLLMRLAKPLGLVDHPDSRKQHTGHVPLVGGLSVFAGLLVGASCLGDLSHFTRVLLATSAVLMLLGSLDDRFDLSVRSRLLVQTSAILVVIGATGVYIHSLGHLFGTALTLGWLGVPFTVVAVIGLLNAFNMMDGIDGLAGSLSLVSIGAILLYSSHTKPNALMLLAGVTLLPYLAANLGFLGPKRRVFLGDAGSMMLGYLLAWTLIDLSQTVPRHLSPVDVLWCVALPVFDTLAVMYRRMRQGKSPFKPDRGHIHHILMGAGLGQRHTLICLTVFAAALAFFGSVVRLLGSAPSLVAFLALTFVYTFTVSRIWNRQKVKRIPLHAQAANDTVIHSGSELLEGLRANPERLIRRGTRSSTDTYETCQAVALDVGTAHRKAVDVGERP